LELIVDGRLDAYWADHLSQEITRVIHGGVHHVRLHLGGVQYISSAGIRVLLQFHKQLVRINGSLFVCEPSAAVRSVIQLTGLEELLVAGEAVAPERMAAGAGPFVERLALHPGARLACRLLGTPTPFPPDGFQRHHCRSVEMPQDCFALGLGALGGDYEDCHSRFGEWLAVGGAAAYLPAGRTTAPDYAVSTGNYRPMSQVLYGLFCHGVPAWHTRFEAQDRGVVTLTEVLEHALTTAHAGAAGIVLAAETSSLVGAALRQAPTEPLRGRVPLAHPEIREWLTFTPERGFPQSLTLAVGVAARRPGSELAPWLRPVGQAAALHAHVHAAVFSYHPLRRGGADLAETVRVLFEQQTLQGLLHLVKDDRAIHGAGDSEFTRGLCWIGPIDEVGGVGLAP
jgi:anti-anti-sigma factor